MTTTNQLIEKYEGFLSSNPEFEPIVKEFIKDLKQLQSNEPKVNLTTQVKCIDPELINNWKWTTKYTEENP